MHVHLDHDHCLEVLVVKGKGSEIKKVADALVSVKGVKHGKLTMTTTGKGWCSCVCSRRGRLGSNHIVALPVAAAAMKQDAAQVGRISEITDTFLRWTLLWPRSCGIAGRDARGTPEIVHASLASGP